eukprot:gnl/TRDRNA2_/TRDRNA2_185361_c0_seq1.p1 gnl/TRDRNA2_/TRDRNA2_185361_c0~~gnl/TRDRNA2_/TRDRNA2_185361_c0_seq1.p1  ORF type:complete len:673 (-),score=144.64 gnl/TRDRNA2_/TRDRNA2_185361_c0_seq1:99-2117(-)
MPGEELGFEGVEDLPFDDDIVGGPDTLPPTDSGKPVRGRGMAVEDDNEFSVGLHHWGIFLAIAFGVWWLRSRGSGGGQSGSSQSSRPSAVSVEEQRRKRLEALERRGAMSPSAAQATPVSEQGGQTATAAANTEDSPGDGMRKRTVASADPAPAVPAAASVAAAPTGPAATSSSLAAAEEEPLVVRRRREALEAKRAAAAMEPKAPGSPSAAATAADEEPLVVRKRREALEAAKRAEAGAATAPAAATATGTPAAASAAAPVTTAPPMESAGSIAPASAPSTPAPSGAFAVKVKGTLRATSSTHSIEGLTAATTVQSLTELVMQVFKPGEGARIRLFFNGKELKVPDAKLGATGIGQGAMVQAMFITASSAVNTSSAGTASVAAPASVTPAADAAPSQEQLAEAVTAATEAAAKDSSSPVFDLRAQGAMKGAQTETHTIKDLKAITPVGALQDRVYDAFGAADDVIVRLFFMGREFKDPLATLSSVGLVSGSVVQVMFSPGSRPRRSAATAAPAASQGSATPAADSATVDAVSAAAAAAGCDPAALFAMAGVAPGASSQAAGATAPASGAGASSSPQTADVDPAEAWRALAQLEVQLARADDPSEDQQVRQASQVLRQMLTTMTHSGNPTLLQFAQAAVPDIKLIWGFDSTRERLCSVLAMSSSSSSGGGAA